MRQMLMIIPVLICVSGGAVAGTLFDTPVTYVVGTEPRAVVSGQFNGDGYPDLAVANQATDNISVFLNDQSGGFGAAVNYDAGDQPSGICAADVNKDTHLDLVVANMGSDSVSVFLGDGSGDFAAAADYRVGIPGALPREVFAADFDDDDYLDLAVANEWADSVAVLINNKDGTFPTHVSYHLGAGAAPKSLCVDDFDDDGFVDIAVANSGTDDISILINDQDGTFTLAASYPSGDSPRCVRSSDIDADGFADLVVASYGSHEMTVLINNQDGTFGDAEFHNAGSNPRAVCAVELNGDANIDVAAVNWTSNDASIYINNGDGTFPADDVYGVGTDPTAVCAADFDLDTDNDLAVCLHGADSLAILLNTTVPQVGVEEAVGDGLPVRMNLAQNYPNPFNPDTRIEFSLPQRSWVVISVFNINGRLVRNLLDKELAAGDHEVWWDGCDDAGQGLATGIYLYRLTADESVQTRKMVLLK